MMRSFRLESWVLALWYFCVCSVNAVVTTASAPQYLGDFSSETITCLGTVPPKYRWSEHREHLAEFCAYETGAFCETYPPQHISFYKLEIELPTPQDHDYDDYLGDPHYEQIQQAAELCFIKCNCTKMTGPRDRAALQGGEPPPDYGLWSGDLLEWNFDHGRSIRRWRQNGETAWWKDGHSITGTSDDDLGSEAAAGSAASVNSGLESDHDRDIETFQYYVGAPVNKPTCRNVELSPEISHYLSLYTVIWEYNEIAEVYNTPTELCLHRYYGGHNFTSFGGVCITASTVKPELQFPYSLKAPIFTLDWPRPSNLASAAYYAAIRQYCSTYCWCGEEPEEPATNSTLALLAEVEAASCSMHSEESPTCKNQGTQTNDQPIYEGIGHLLNSTDGLATVSCGGNCTINDEASKPACPGKESDCSCTALQPNDPLGFSSGKFVAVCLSAIIGNTATQMVNGAPNNVGSGGSGKRRRRFSSDDTFESDGQRKATSVERACPCNVTYISRACCLSGDDGLIWEESHLKLGSLI